MKINNEDYYALNSWDQILNKFEIKFKTRSTGVLVSLCPFHNEKTPSCRFWPKSGNFLCLGCGLEGDKFNFILRCIDSCKLEDKIEFDQIFQDNPWINSPNRTHLFVDSSHPEFPFVAEFN